MNDKNLYQDLFDLVLYMVSSAEGLKEETKDYGPLRLLEAVSRLGKLMDEMYDDEVMRQVIEEIDQNKNLVMTDKKKFYDFLTRLVIKLTKQAKQKVQKNDIENSDS